LTRNKVELEIICLVSICQGASWADFC